MKLPAIEFVRALIDGKVTSDELADLSVVVRLVKAGDKEATLEVTFRHDRLEKLRCTETVVLKENCTITLAKLQNLFTFNFNEGPHTR